MSSSHNSPNESIFVKFILFVLFICIGLPVMIVFGLIFLILDLLSGGALSKTKGNQGSSQNTSYTQAPVYNNVIDYETASEPTLTQRAQNGDVEAQAALGRKYYFGNKNYKMAYYWATIAAQNNHKLGYYILGVLYLNGKYVARNRDTARNMFINGRNLGHQASARILYEQFGI